VAVGDNLKKTVDMLSSPGSAILAHGDARVLERDYECIHEMDLFLVEEGGGEGEEEGEGSLTSGEGGGSSSGGSMKGEEEEEGRGEE